MKKFAGTWVVVAIFAALLAYLLVVKPKSADERKEDSLTLTSSKRETIDRIEITNPSGTIVVARVSGPGPVASPAPSASPVATPVEVWKITAPRELPVEDASLSQMKNALSDLIAVDPVWTAPTEEERKQVGLDLPATKVSWHAADGDHTLSVGKPFPKRDQVYAQVSGKPGVFLVRKFAVEVFTKGLNDLRRHKVFDFDRDEVKSISVETKDGKFVATRTDALAPWNATSPFQGRADRGKLNNVIAKIAALRAEAFVDAVNPQALAKPRATITLGAGGTQTLVIGDDSGTGKWIAKDGNGVVFVAGSDLPSDLKGPLAAWRDSTLLDFPVEDVSTLEITLGGATFGFHRDDTKMFVSNDGPNVNAEAAQFLRTVKTATVSERSEKGSFGFEKPALSASWVVGSGDKAQKIEIAVGAAKGKGHWVKTSEMPSAQLVSEDLVAAAQALLRAAKPAVTSSAAKPEKSGG